MNRRTLDLAIIVACGCCMILLMASQDKLERAIHGNNDFLGLYVGARLAGTGNLYDAESNLALHNELIGGIQKGVLYSRPPFYALLLKPLAKLPYEAAYIAFELFNLIACCTFVWLWRGQKEVLLLTALNIPLAMAFLMGQDLPIVLALASLAYLALAEKREWVAGILFSLCSIKLHFFVFIPFVLLAQRRWRVLYGLGIGGGILLAISTIVEGTGWPARYASLLARPELHANPAVMPNLRGISNTLLGSDNFWFLSITAALVIAAVLWTAHRQTLQIACSAALVGGVLIAYHTYFHDASILLLSIALGLGGSSKLLRITGAAAVAPPVHFLLGIGPPWNIAAPIASCALLAALCFAEKTHSIETSSLEPQKA